MLIKYYNHFTIWFNDVCVVFLHLDLELHSLRAMHCKIQITIVFELVDVFDNDSNRIKVKPECQNVAYFLTGLWNNEWLPSPHGNGFLRIRKCSYGMNSGRG